MFTANIYTPLEGNGSNTTMPLKVFTHRLFQKRMQSSKIFEAFEVRGQGQGLSSRTTLALTASQQHELQPLSESPQPYLHFHLMLTQLPSKIVFLECYLMTGIGTDY